MLLSGGPGLIPKNEKPRMSGAEDGKVVRQNYPESRKRTFFRLFRLSALRETYLVMEECMVEAAGVEPHCAVHLFASPCTYRSLSASNDISKIGGNADRCS